MAWPWIWPTLLLIAWAVALWAITRWLFKGATWHTIEDARIRGAVRAAAWLLFLLGVMGWLLAVPLLSDNISDTSEQVWAWLWPSLLALAAFELARTVDRWGRENLAPRMAANSTEVREKTVKNLVRATSVSAILGALVGWSLVVPLSSEIEDFIRVKILPWFWPTVTLIGWLFLGIVTSRRFIAWVHAKAAVTSTEFDDAIVGAIKKPLWLIIVATGLALWARLVPMPSALEDYIDAIAKGAAVLMLVLFADAFVQTWMTQRQERSKVLRTSGGVLRSAAKAVIYLMGMLMVLSTMGIDITPLIASLGVGSIAVGLALQRTLEDFLAGLILAADQPIRVGDFVTLDPGLEGVVLSIGWRSCQLRTRDDMHVIVPNSKLAGATLINRSMPSRLVTFVVPVGVAYGTDLKRASDTALEVASEVLQSHPAGVQDYEPKCVYTDFGDSAVNFAVWLRATDWERHFGLKSAYIEALHRRFEADGVVIPFPIRTLDLPDGTEMTVKRLS